MAWQHFVVVPIPPTRVKDARQRIGEAHNGLNPAADAHDRRAVTRRIINRSVVVLFHISPHDLSVASASVTDRTTATAAPARISLGCSSRWASDNRPFGFLISKK